MKKRIILAITFVFSFFCLGAQAQMNNLLSGDAANRIAISLSDLKIEDHHYVLTFIVDGKKQPPKKVLKDLEASISFRPFNHDRIEVAEMTNEGVIVVKWWPTRPPFTLKADIEESWGGYITGTYVKDVPPILCPDEVHPHYIELGLPSGKKWCCTNAGAEKPGKKGSQYTWEEAQIFLVANKNKKNDDEIKIEIPVLPHAEDVEELANYCYYNMGTVDGVEGTLVTGANYNRIFFPNICQPGDDEAASIPSIWTGDTDEAHRYSIGAILTSMGIETGTYEPELLFSVRTLVEPINE